MNRIMLPVDQVDSTPNSDNKDFLFAPGPWTGRIEITRSKGIPTDKDGKPFAGYTSADGEVISIQLGSNAHVEGEQQDEIGNRKMFHDFAIECGGASIADMDLTERNSPNWQLQRSVRSLTQFAIALGQAEQVEDESGNAFWAVSPDFVDNLRNGDFDGRSVGYTVAHRSTKSKVRPVVANIDGFYQVD